VRVTPSEQFVGGEIEVGQTQSSQFISALLLVGSALESGLRIRFRTAVTSESYVELTRMTIQRFELDSYAIVDDDRRVEELHVRPLPIPPCEFWVTPDASSAVYWALAAAAVSGSTIRLANLGFPLAGGPSSPRMTQMPQPDLGAILLLMRGGETFADDADVLRLSDFRITDPIVLNCDKMPDGAVAIAAFTPLLKKQSRLTGLRTLRVKETDRIAALANELRRVGCSVETGEDWIEITPPASLRKNAGSDDQREEDPDWREAQEQQTRSFQSGSSSRGGRSPDPALTIIETYNDHRMAMAFAVLGLAAPNGHRLAIRNPACVAKSYPTFWKDFAKLYQ
jgi:3-phosphoshikimate 1-carboxyvinyltransferase